MFYSLTTPIKTSFTDTARLEVLQILTVKNNGNLKAERIIISIYPFKGSHQVKKYSSTDEVTSKINGYNFEMIYPTLPPEGQFEVLFKTNSTVNELGLLIKSDSGVAKGVFDKQKNHTQIVSIVLIFLGILSTAILYLLIFKRGSITLTYDK